MLNLSLNKLKLIAKSRAIKCCKSISKNRLLSALSVSESLKECGKSFDDKKSTRNKDYDVDEILRTTVPDLKILEKE